MGRGRTRNTRAPGCSGKAPLLLALLGLVGALLVGLAWWVLEGGSGSEAVDGVERTSDNVPSMGMNRETAPERRVDAGDEEEGDTELLLLGSSAAERRVGLSPAEVATAQELSGQVVDGVRGAPVAGAQVVLSDDAQEVQGETDSEGRFLLRWPDARAARLEVRHSRYVDLRQPLVDFSVDQFITLTQSGWIEGRVDGGSPEAIAVARALLWNYAASKFQGKADLETSLASDGRFKIDDLEPGEYALAVVVEDGPLAYEEGIHVRAGEPCSVRLSMTPGGEIQGRIIARGTREPVESVSVLVRPQPQGVSSSIAGLVDRRATTDSAGRFRLAGVPAGTNKLVLRTPWGSTMERSIHVPAGDPLEVELPVVGPASVAGRVLDAGGRPVGGCGVLLVTDKELGKSKRALGTLLEAEKAQRVFTDGSGAFQFDAVPARESVALAAWSQDSATPSGFKRVHLQEGEARADIELSLVELEAIEGFVTDTMGERLDGVEVVLRLRTGLGEKQKFVTGTDGRFAFTDVPQGFAHVTCEKPGYTRVRRAVSGGKPVEIQLTADLRLTGTVVDAHGYALRGAYVRAMLVGTERARGSRTGPFGRFELTRLSPGDWEVEGRVIGTQVQTEPVLVTLPSEDDVLIIVEPEERLERASVSGEVVAQGTGAPLPGLRFEGLKSGATVAVEGARFRITGLPPTRTRFTARAPGMEPILFDPVDLRPGTHVDLGRVEVRSAATVVVSVVDPSGRPVKKAKVVLRMLGAGKGGWGQKSRAFRFRDTGNGRHVLTNVPRYKWRLEVTHPKWVKHKRVVDVRKDRQGFKVALKAK